MLQMRGAAVPLWTLVVLQEGNVTYYWRSGDFEFPQP